MKSNSLVLLLALFIATLAPGALADAAPSLSVTIQDISLSAKADDIATFDFDGDGRGDIAVLERDRIHIYFQRSDERYLAQPDLTVFPGSRMVMADFHDMNADGKCDLVIASTRGVYWREFSFDGNEYTIQRKLHKMTRDAPRFSPSSAGTFPWLQFVSDLNEDGRPDFWLPADEGIVLHYGSDEGFEASKPFFFMARSNWKFDPYPSRLQASIHYEFTYGGIRLIDFNADGRKDLVYVTNDRLVIYPQTDEARFDQNKQYSISLPGDKVGDLIGARPLQIDDLDGDGFPDLVFLLGDDGIIKIYRGGPGIRSFDRPVQIIREKGYIYRAYVTDIDGDGRKDLFTEQAGKVTWGKALRIYLSKSVTTYAQVYRNVTLDADEGEERIFSKKYNFLESFNTSLVIQVGYTGIADIDSKNFVTSEHDFTNDGRSDLFALTDRREVSLYLANGEKNLYAKSPDFSYTIPDSDPYLQVAPVVDDLDRNGHPDFIIWYKNVLGGKDKIAVCFTRSAR